MPVLLLTVSLNSREWHATKTQTLVPETFLPLNSTRQSVAVQREEGIPVEKETLAQDLPSDIVLRVNTHDMIASVCATLNGV